MIRRAITAAALTLLAGCGSLIPDVPTAVVLPGAAAGSSEIPDYDRDAFGQAWSDDVTVPYGHNGCDTRNDVLALQLADVQIKPGTGGCVVLAGTLYDPYTDAPPLAFHRGDGQVEIDHVVALSWAWQHGAWAWTDGQRRDFANDTANLRATATAVNRAKGDSGPAEWMPPSSDLLVACDYSDTWLMLLDLYGLEPGLDDAAKLADVEATCT